MAGSSGPRLEIGPGGKASGMAKRLIVDLNIEKIRQHLSSEDGRAWSRKDVLKWLEDAGFKPHGDRWLVEERHLGQVQPVEVNSIEDEPD